jgi:hypothetical protein
VPAQTDTGRTMRVFLSYRRGDAGGYAGRLTDALFQRLGPKSVFQDVTAISPGQDYTVAIDRALDDSDAALVVIGPGWLTAVTPTFHDLAEGSGCWRTRTIRDHARPG